MIKWFRSIRQGIFFGVLADDAGIIYPGHELAENTAQPRTDAQLRNQFSADWHQQQEINIQRYGFDVDRPAETWVNQAAYANLMRDAQAIIARDNLLNRDGLRQIPAEEDEPVKKETRWLPMDTTGIPERGTPRFWIPYQSGDEIVMRLQNSIISVKSKPVHVHRVENVGNEFCLYLLDGEGGRFTLSYNDPAVDLRSPSPGYGVSKDGIVSYLVRRPERVQRQGMCTENTLKKTAGRKAWTVLQSQQEILQHLFGRKSRVVTKAILETMEEGLLHNVLLSPKVALVGKQSGIYAEYKGRTLGRVRGQGVVLSDEDAGMSHIRADLQAVHLEA